MNAWSVWAFLYIKFSYERIGYCKAVSDLFSLLIKLNRHALRFSQLRYVRIGLCTKHYFFVSRYFSLSRYWLWLASDYTSPPLFFW